MQTRALPWSWQSNGVTLTALPESQVPLLLSLASSHKMGGKQSKQAATHPLHDHVCVIW